MEERGICKTSVRLLANSMQMTTTFFATPGASLQITSQPFGSRVRMELGAGTRME